MDSPSQPDTFSRRQEFLTGARDIAPLLLGAAPFGLIYGVLAISAGLSPQLAVASSMIVFAGSAQFIGAQLIGAPLRRHVPAITAVLLVALGVFAILARPTSVTAAISAHEHAEHEVPTANEALPGCCGD